jgi:microcystin-dependent protein
MAQPFLAEIRIFSFNFAPRGWAQCNGQLLPINQNQALFALLGTTYGGNGTTNFGLPDFRSRMPFGYGTTFSLGERGGSENVTLTLTNLPAHTHPVIASNNSATTNDPTGTVWANSTTNPFSTQSPDTPMAPGAMGSVGGNQPHPNMSPYLVLNLCIALQGIFPSQN